MNEMTECEAKELDEQIAELVAVSTLTASPSLVIIMTCQSCS